jgi:hypothetical protein
MTSTRRELFDEALAKFDEHGFRGTCKDCGYRPDLSMSVSEWIQHHLEDKIIALQKAADLGGLKNV